MPEFCSLPIAYEYSHIFSVAEKCKQTEFRWDNKIVDCPESEASDDVGPTLGPRFETTSSQNVSESPSSGNEVEYDNLQQLGVNITTNSSIGTTNGTGSETENTNSSGTVSLISRVVFCVCFILNVWYW